MHHKHKHQTNHLDIYRNRMRLKPLQVAKLLGHKTPSTLSHYERGQRLPSLTTALRLAIILRVPIEFLFPALHEQLRSQIRAKEEQMRALPFNH